MLTKRIDDQGVIRLDESEIAEYGNKRVVLIKLEDNQEVIDLLGKIFASEAETAGFLSEQEMQDYMLEIRREVRGY